ncbi:MAG: no significant homology Putative N-terminal signal sequence was found by PSORT, partial [uncultured Nocardioidaceae bacterium]
DERRPHHRGRRARRRQRRDPRGRAARPSRIQLETSLGQGVGAAHRRARPAGGGRGVAPGGRRGGAPPLGRAVRRLRRHGWTALLVDGGPRRRRQRGRGDLDPRPLRRPDLRQGCRAVVRRPAAVAGGGRRGPAGEARRL